MKDQVAKAFNNLKEFWANLAPKVKKLVLMVGGLVLAASIVLVIALNLAARKMTVLFPQLSTAETTAVCNVLSEMGVTAEINSKGEIMVPAEQRGELQVQLAGRGYPQSAPTYDLYLNNSGFTRTESERRQIYIYQLQERIQASLLQSKGVDKAIATITIPEDSGYVWDQAKGESSASVMITMEPGYELTGERVSAIKNLVAFSVVPQMNPENVKVVDAATGIEVLPEDGKTSGTALELQRLEYEYKVKKNIEDNIRRLLTPLYGADGVTPVAWVTLDYDKMLTEQHQVVPEDDGNGVKTYLEEQYNIDGQVPMEGLVGEDDNTDVPRYPNNTGEGENPTTAYQRRLEWENSYINTQIEKGQAILKEATVSVLVNDLNFTEDKRDSLIDMISKAVNISPEYISVNNYDLAGQATQPADTQPDEIIDRRLIFAAAGAGLILLILIIILVSVLRGRAKKRRLAAEEDEAATREKELQDEIDRHKRELASNAQAQAASNSKETAITNEVREFAKDNPEITANLIRSMLKEDE